MAQLALFGGDPVIPQSIELYNSIGEEEIQAVNEVMRSGVLSQFIGGWCDDFFGGPWVRKFEEAWSQQFGVKYSITVNSATSGLFAAVGAVGIEPGDEVIVPPYTMSATAMAPLVYGGIPVFADIEEETFCIDPAQVKRLITPATKAIIAVNLFGHAASLKELRKVADDHGLKLIEDNAQGPLATEEGVYAGTIGHIGVFSLNYHKHIHTGEGGVCVTNDDELALRMQMIRNHGENIVEHVRPTKGIANIVGFNYRMTELSAAVGVEQLKKIEYHVAARETVSTRLTELSSDFPGITPPAVRPGCRHVYYNYALKYEEDVVGVPRELFAKALKAEGFPAEVGYVQPLYQLPLFQERVAIGSKGFPFNLTDRSYNKGLCPTAEDMYYRRLVQFNVCSYDVSMKTIENVALALRKVYENRKELRSLGSNAALSVC